ncbi:homocysteine-responsive endoplasmic reticulum-resident ubiquitin-like domain member 2 protein isoform X2 [Pecten maximus]|uniref:homocysteine-responsive endoplasmic reticulum-resident ubiquitin-like domain member 2 protein isoform X2 n=1 Tax=Pecten maximus TaxID=6579 RepID=UPI00145841DD|nr:homocysteine-responsive endoplasmic reticulum-resident ubiquitin-like domain member 2 protein isoform X2 [Pecten maximus]
MDLGDSPITLVIKAPNQRLEDQTVECMLGWTVRKLKKHLENVYPSKPKETQQKLIYSGKLLPDDATLKDVLRQPQGCSSQHTVHLVCSTGLDFNATTLLDNKPNGRSYHMPDPSYNLTTQPNVIPTTTSSTEGLRHRNHGSTDTTTPGASQGGIPQANLQMPQMPQMQQMPQMMMPPGAEAFYTPEQMMMMQNYYYQMATAQYMQYYQTGVNPTPPNTPTTPVEDAAPNQNDPNNQAPANGGEGNGNNLVMNAQGGMMAADDDDDDFGQRDWLDYVHTFARFAVLISIVYFYSNFTRFLIVFAFFFLIYLYQTGWFQLARRVPENRQEANVQQQEQPPTEHQEEQQQQQQQQANPETDELPAGEGQTEEERPAPPEQPPPQESVLAVIWCFISTFFTSLIPQQPQAVNAN